jgi:NADH-quinone oxidoreductase subunit L
VFALFDSVQYDAVFASAPDHVGETVNFLWMQVDALTLICLLLFMGAMGKSAQFLLHTWLPDAMEGPTPVSALIHAATMVTAGVFMVARLSPLFELAPIALAVVTIVGATTAFFAATVGLVQNDIKRVVAYSTCSQLGYMFAAEGVGAYGAGMFHLFTHASFKALLFLGAGAVIHALHHEQDLRRMGALRRVLPFTWAMMLIGTLSLTGFPFTAGFVSKDAIIESTYAAHTSVGMYAFVLTLIAAVLTSFYSWRLMFLAFEGKAREPKELLEHAHEPNLTMTVPLAVLALGALLTGGLFAHLFIGTEQAEFWRGSLVVHEHHHVPLWVVLAPSVAMALGFAVAWYFYITNPLVPFGLAKRFRGAHQFLLNAWYFDALYDGLFVRPALRLGRFLWKTGDGTIIDGIGPDGVAARVIDIANRAIRLQTGYIYHYAFVMLIGVALLITYFLFAGGGLNP